MKSLFKNGLQLFLGCLFLYSLGTKTVTAQSFLDKYLEGSPSYIDTSVYMPRIIWNHKPSEAEIDEIRQYGKLEKIMASALKFEIRRDQRQDKKYLPFDAPLDVPLKGETKQIYLRVERLPEELKIIIAVGRKNLYEKVSLGQIEVYLIFNEKSRVTIDQATVLFNRLERSVIYTDFEDSKLVMPGGEFVIKQTSGFITKLITETGVIGRRMLEQIGNALAPRKFQMWVEEKDRVLEIGFDMTGSKVLAYPLNLEAALPTFFSDREEKARIIRVKTGEKKVKAVLIYYSLAKRKMLGIYNDISEIEHEDIKILPLD